MKTITLNIPEKVDLNTNETVKFIAAKLYESGKLSLGQAAELADLSKVAFSEIIGDYGVSLFNYPAEEIADNVARI